MSAAGHGFSALNTGLEPPSGPLIATVEVHPEPPSDASFPDPITWETTKATTASTAAEESAAAEGEHDGTATAAVAVAAAASASGGGACGAASTETARRLVVAESPSVAGEGYQTGKWLWEWHIVSCGNRVSVGVCGHDVAAISAAGVPVHGAGGGTGAGDRADLWLYRSDGNLLHGGESTEGTCPAGGFDSGDVVGVELDADAGTLVFLKNDSYVGGQFKIVRRSGAAKGDSSGGDGCGGGGGRSRGGLYPCVSLRGSGDTAVLLGLKEGAATITYRSPPSDEKGGGSGRNSPSPPPPPPLTSGDVALSVLSAAAEAVAAAAATVGGGDAEALVASTASERAATAAGPSPDQPPSSSSGSAEEPAAAAAAAVAESSQAAAAAAAATSADSAPDSAAEASGSSSQAADDGAVEGTASSGSAAVDAAASSPPSPSPLPPPPLSPPPAAVSTALPVPSFHPAYFHGEFVRGLKHGPGVLRLSGKGGYWTGKWFQGVKHGVHLLVEPPAKKGQAEEDGSPTAWLFDRGEEVCVVRTVLCSR